MKMRMFLIIGMMFFTMQSAFAFSWSDLWWRPDQQGVKALQTEQPIKAANLFTTPDWQGVAYYRAGKYQQAYQSFSKDNSASGYYNQGNALAYLGNYQAAIDAYNQAIKQKPDFSAAQYNKEIVEKLLQQQKNDQPQSDKQNNSQQQNDPSQSDKQNNLQQQNDPSQSDKQNNSQQQNDPSQSDKQNNLQQQNNPPQSDKQNNSQQQNDPPQSGKQNNSQQQNDPSQLDKQNNSQQQNDPSQSDKQNNSQSPSNNDYEQAGSNSVTQPLKTGNKGRSTQQSEQQPTDQWLQSIPDDPGGLLQQKFLRDHATYQQLQQQGQQPW